MPGPRRGALPGSRSWPGPASRRRTCRRGGVRLQASPTRRKLTPERRPRPLRPRPPSQPGSSSRAWGPPLPLPLQQQQPREPFTRRGSPASPRHGCFRSAPTAPRRWPPDPRGCRSSPPPSWAPGARSTTTTSSPRSATEGAGAAAAGGAGRRSRSTRSAAAEATRRRRGGRRRSRRWSRGGRRRRGRPPSRRRPRRRARACSLREEAGTRCITEEQQGSSSRQRRRRRRQCSLTLWSLLRREQKREKRERGRRDSCVCLFARYYNGPTIGRLGSIQSKN